MLKKKLMCTYIHIFVLIWTFFSVFSFIHKQERNCLSPSNKQQRSSNNVDDRRKKNCLYTHTCTDRKKRRRRKSDVLIIRRTFSCYGVFVSTKEWREKERSRMSRKRMRKEKKKKARDALQGGENKQAACHYLSKLA
jgi:hypothetical protein